MNKKIGFIGCGNMARAMITGLLDSNIAVPGSIIASNSTAGKLEAVRQDYGIETTSSNRTVARFADILVLSVKPNKYKGIIEEIKNEVKKDVIIVTIAAGIEIRTVEAAFGKELKVVRAMPNIPAIVGEAMTALCCNGQVAEEELETIHDIFSSFGLVEIIEEELLDVITAVSASSPALVYMFIEALTDGAVLKGLSRDKAYRMVSQAVLGAAKMVLVTGKHPGQLKDSVCSAGGTAIEAVYSLEKKGFRGHVIEAIQKCTEKAEKLGAQMNGR
ncbi:MAG: pyrroline-5-carboxylate reductase [Clostridia bacterium BRH_c25]|nr:MAG: pyrroline-5-carboxylate reductase [Clostridia bacterium BRH_c25]